MNPLKAYVEWDAFFETDIIMSNGIFIKKSNAYNCAVISVFGLVFLIILGSLFSTKAYTLVKGKHALHDPVGTGNACLIAAGMYAVTLVFSAQQILAHRRNSLRLQ